MDAVFPKVGCCGFRLSKAEYAARFPVVEVQQTFYQPPGLATLKRWRATVPRDFEFTLKAWQLITHASHSPTYRRLKSNLTAAELEQCGSFQPTPMVEQAWLTTRACAKALAARRLLFQCPASFTPTLQNITQMRDFFTTIKRGDLTLLWEPRGNWPETLIQALCHDLNLVHVVDPFLARSLTPDFIYFRLHGGKDFQHIYSNTELRKLLALLPIGKPAYVMFNNVNMLEDATRFQEMAEPLHSIRELEFK
ncbi:MAG: hypothetical protein JWR19_3360 [Pedosphaera sp.]|nr:hypothetical protein [Pedosphaera sp.]